MADNDDKKDAVPLEPQFSPTGDFTNWDLTVLGRFKDQGLPNVSRVTSDQLSEMVNLYMNGETYNNISMRLNIKKAVVLYYAEKQDWFGQKQRYLQDLATNLGHKVASAKLEGVDHLVNTFHFFKDYYDNKFSNFSRTKDDRVAESVNTKFMPHMFKAIEMLQKIGAPDANQVAQVNINLTGSATVKSDGNKVDISSNEQPSVEEVLAHLAKMKREGAQADIVIKAEPIETVEEKEEKPEQKNPKTILKKKKIDF